MPADIKRYQAIGFGANEGIWLDNGSRIQFRNGLYETSSKSIQDKIESTDYWTTQMITSLDMGDEPVKKVNIPQPVEGVMTTSMGREEPEQPKIKRGRKPKQ